MIPPLARVLYVEDQPAVASVVLLELEQAHLAVTTVPTGEQCLVMAREKKFDLILLDQLLPKLDGIEVCRRLKSDPALRMIPVIFLTAFPNRHHELEARKLGAADYLQKGIVGGRLAARILAEVEQAKAHNPNPPAKAVPSPQPQPPPQPQPQQEQPVSWLKSLFK